MIALDVTESRRAHEHLQQTRERLDTAQRMARVGSWSWDVTGDRWHWSEELFRIAGLPPAARPPDFRSLLGAIPPEHRGRVPRRHQPGAARRAPVRDPLPRAAARRRPADPARPRRPGAGRRRGRRAHPRLRPGRHGARARGEPAARGGRARPARAVGRDARGADARGGRRRRERARARLRRRSWPPPRTAPRSRCARSAAAARRSRAAAGCGSTRTRSPPRCCAPARR